LSDLQPVFVVGGIGVLAHALEAVLTNTGQSDKVVFLKITTYCSCAFVAWEIWWKLVREVERMFGV
jgi:hypothetical protein